HQYFGRHAAAPAQPEIGAGPDRTPGRDAGRSELSGINRRDVGSGARGEAQRGTVRLSACLKAGRRGRPFLFQEAFERVNSRFMRAMLLSEISLGHSASQAYVFVQLPNPSSSICATMFSTRAFRSAWPCGRTASWEIFAATKSIADAFLQAATHAPQPMQAAL